jgi:hypothetical protein
MESRSHGVLDRPVKPGDDSWVQPQLGGGLFELLPEDATNLSSSMRKQGPITTGVGDAKIVCHIVSIESTTRYGSRRSPGRPPRWVQLLGHPCERRDP